MIIDHHEKGTTPQKGKHTKTVIDCSTLFGVSSPNEVTLSPKCCTLMTPVGKRTDFNACLSLRNGATLFFFFPLLWISTCRFSLSSAQDHTIACVPQGSYGSCLWVNSLMWLGNSSTAIRGSIVKKHGQMFMEHSMRKI